MIPQSGIMISMVHQQTGILRNVMTRLEQDNHLLMLIWLLQITLNVQVLWYNAFMIGPITHSASLLISVAPKLMNHKQEFRIWFIKLILRKIFHQMMRQKSWMDIGALRHLSQLLIDRFNGKLIISDFITLQNTLLQMEPKGMIWKCKFSMMIY